jgi:TonB family protein
MVLSVSLRRTPLSLLLPIVALATVATPARAQEGRREEVKREEPKLTRPPRLLHFEEAVYPAKARARGLQGSVVLEIVVSATGSVSKARVLSSPDPELAAAALAAVRRFRFSPAEVDGKPAPVQIQYAYNFVLGVEFTPRLPDWMRDRRQIPEGEAALVGRVREQGTRLPLAGVAVAVAAAGIEVRTDDRGAFSIPKLAPGRYRVEAISLEHRREKVEAEIREGEQTRIEFYLPRVAANPYETVVRGARKKTTVTRITLRQKELTTVPGTFGDPIRVIENLPGVSRLPFVGGGLLIRGSPPSDSGVYLDGVEIPILYHFLGGPSVLNPEFLDRIDYYPGNVEVRYGRLNTGVVDVGTRDTFTRQWGGAVDINLLNVAALLKVPISRRVSVAASVRRSYIDALLPPVLQAIDRPATTVVPVYYDYQLRVDVRLPRDNQLYLLVFGSDDALAIATNEPADKVSVSLDSRISFHRLLARWRWQISDRLVSKLAPYVGVDYVTFASGDSSIDLRAFAGGVREDLELTLSRRLRLRTGVDLRLEIGRLDSQVPIPVDYRNPGSGLAALFTDEVVPLTIDQEGLGLAAYLDAVWQVTRRLQLIPGARFELLRDFGKNRLYVDPRLIGRFTLAPKTTLKGGVGLFSKAPEPRNLSSEFGNPNLGLEHALHVSAGIEQKLFENVTLDAQLYLLHRYSQVVPTTQARLEGGVLRPLRFTNQGNGYSYGLELLLKHDVTRRFYGWVAYTLSRSLQQREPDGEYRLFTFDQTHILTLVASVRLGVGWEIGARFRLVSGRPDTPVLGAIFDSDRNRYRAIRGESDSSRLPLFHQLDLRIEKTWFFKLWRLSAYLDVQNIYNAENPEATLYDYRFKESGPLRGLPILPTLGVKGSF